MKKLVVNDNCIGCGACIAIDNTHFDFNDEGLSHVVSNENLDTPELQNAIASCPVNAIKLEEGCNCDCGCNETGECNCEDCDCEHKN